MRGYFQKMSGKQTGKQFFFQKSLKKQAVHAKFLLYYSETLKRDKNPIKQLWDGRTAGRTDGRPDQLKSGLVT